MITGSSFMFYMDEHTPIVDLCLSSSAF